MSYICGHVHAAGFICCVFLSVILKLPTSSPSLSLSLSLHCSSSSSSSAFTCVCRSERHWLHRSRSGSCDLCSGRTTHRLCVCVCVMMLSAVAPLLLVCLQMRVLGKPWSQVCVFSCLLWWQTSVRVLQSFRETPLSGSLSGNLLPTFTFIHTWIFFLKIFLFKIVLPCLSWTVISLFLGLSTKDLNSMQKYYSNCFKRCLLGTDVLDHINLD